MKKHIPSRKARQGKWTEGLQQEEKRYSPSMIVTSSTEHGAFEKACNIYRK
jgi:hypothetical protein